MFGAVFLHATYQPRSIKYAFSSQCNDDLHVTNVSSPYPVPVQPVESRIGAKNGAAVRCTLSLVPSLFLILAGIAVPVRRVGHSHFAPLPSG